MEGRPVGEYFMTTSIEWRLYVGGHLTELYLTLALGDLHGIKYRERLHLLFQHHS
jgi:hypothetical protein